MCKPEDMLLKVLLSMNGGTGGSGGSASNHGEGGDGGTGQGPRLIDSLFINHVTLVLDLEHTLLSMRDILREIQSKGAKRSRRSENPARNKRTKLATPVCDPVAPVSASTTPIAPCFKMAKERQAKLKKKSKAKPGSSTTPRNLCMIAWCEKNPGGFLYQFEVHWARIEKSGEIKKWEQASADARRRPTRSSARLRVVG